MKSFPDVDYPMSDLLRDTISKLPNPLAAHPPGKLVIVTYLPKWNENPIRPSEGAIMSRLCKLSGVSWKHYLEATVRINLIMDTQDNETAQACKAAFLLTLQLSGRRAVLIGRKVAQAFGLTSELEPGDAVTICARTANEGILDFSFEAVLFPSPYNTCGPLAQPQQREWFAHLFGLLINSTGIPQEKN